MSGLAAVRNSNSYGGFIQYWLLNVGASCPAGWTSFQNGSQLDCWQNDPNGAPVPSSTDVKNLTQLQPGPASVVSVSVVTLLTLSNDPVAEDICPVTWAATSLLPPPPTTLGGPTPDAGGGYGRAGGVVHGISFHSVLGYAP